MLTPEQFHVAREKGTERAFSGAYWDSHDQGMYRCVGCGAALFDSRDKFDSGTGWPSFTKPADVAKVETETDRKFMMTRTEVHCANCETHLGHLFPDGPEGGGRNALLHQLRVAQVRRRQVGAPTKGGQGRPGIRPSRMSGL